MTDLVRKALAVNQAMLALGNEVFVADGATFVRNRDLPSIRDANHVANVTARTPEEIERLLARVEGEYDHCAHRRFDLTFDASPELEARLALEGYKRNDALVMLLEGELAGEAKPHEIRFVESEGDWRAYSALHDASWQEGGEEAEVGHAMFRAVRAKTPPVRPWLACVDGEPRAYLTSWEGVEGVGQVEDLFTHPDDRHRGLATALIHHCVADCRAHGAGPVVIVGDPDDTPKHMYAALGFRPVAINRHYRRQYRKAETSQSRVP